MLSKNIQTSRKYFRSFSSKYSYPKEKKKKIRVLPVTSVAKKKNLEASIPLMQAPFLSNRCFWDTREPEQGAGCQALAYSSQLLLARSRAQQHWDVCAHSATSLAGSSFLGLFPWHFLIPFHLHFLLTTTLNENLCLGFWQTWAFWWSCHLS